MVLAYCVLPSRWRGCLRGVNLDADPMIMLSTLLLPLHFFLLSVLSRNSFRPRGGRTRARVRVTRGPPLHRSSFRGPTACRLAVHSNHLRVRDWRLCTRMHVHARERLYVRVRECVGKRDPLEAWRLPGGPSLAWVFEALPKGPQCPSLIGDFLGVFLDLNVNISIKNQMFIPQKNLQGKFYFSIALIIKQN